MRSLRNRTHSKNRLRRHLGQLEHLEERALLATITGVTLEDVSSELVTTFDRDAIHV
ncbi:MAG: hypothetical protein ACI9G1_000962, partial [Pirellulaceae bacterium]